MLNERKLAGILVQAADDALIAGIGINVEQAATDTLGVFARAGDRFQDVAWEAWDTGAPILSGALASFECATDQIVEAGDHLVFIGRVTRARFEPRRDPLLYFRGKYRRLHFS